MEGTVVACSWYGTKPVDLSLGERFHRDRISIRSSQVGHLDPTLSARWDRKRRNGVVLGLLDEINPAQFITHRIPFENAAAAYRLIDRHPEQTLQVVLTYRGGA
jgi:threonine dehydrogenase-like Zn-dependent dehydrogenase